ncbi:MAG: hypothetical protein ACK2T3_07840 [Candidatus Promineifilaceae bacterium]
MDQRVAVGVAEGVAVAVAVAVGGTVGDGESVGVAGISVDVGGMLVCAAVGVGLVGAAAVGVDIDDMVLDDGVDVGADAQATTKMIARIGVMRGK